MRADRLRKILGKTLATVAEDAERERRWIDAGDHDQRARHGPTESQVVADPDPPVEEQE